MSLLSYSSQLEEISCTHPLQRRNHNRLCISSKDSHTIHPRYPSEALTSLGGDYITFTHFFPVTRFHCVCLPPSSFLLLVILIISQVKSSATLNQQVNKSAVGGRGQWGKEKAEKGGQIREVKEKEEAQGLAFIYQQTSLLVSPCI